MRSPLRNGTVPSFEIWCPSNSRMMSAFFSFREAGQVGSTRRTSTPFWFAPIEEYFLKSGFSIFCHSMPSDGKPV